MKLFKWLKQEIIGNVGIILLALGLAFVCVVVLQMLMV